MKNKQTLTILVIIIVIVILGLVYFYGFGNKNQNEQNNENGTTTEMTQDADKTTAARFTNPESGDSVNVMFNQKDDTATLSGLGYDDVVLDIARSGSGARYVNDDEGLELWNRGEAVTISKDGEEIFSGNIGGKTDADKLTEATWKWMALTSDDGSVVEPEQEGAFTITFDADKGQMNATTDCNAVFGPYTIGENDSLSFGALAMTKKYCEGSQEQVFANALAEVTGFHFDGSGQLVFELGTSTQSMLFSR